MRTIRQVSSTLIVLALLCAASPASAGPWLPGPGSGYAKVSGSHFNATGTYDLEGDAVDPNYEYSNYSVRFYGELGLAPHLGLSASVPFVVGQNRRQTPDGTARYVKRGFGDLDLALQTGTTSGPVALALVGKVRLPLYGETVSADSPNPLQFTQSELNRRRYLPALGDGSVDVTPLAQVGWSLYPVPAWLTASVGPKFRLQGFGDGLEYGVSFGAFAVPQRLAFQARASGVQRFSANNRRPTKSYFQVSGGPIVRLSGPFSFEGTFSYLPVGAFVSKGWSVSAGISYDGRLFSNPFAQEDSSG